MVVVVAAMLWRRIMEDATMPRTAAPLPTELALAARRFEEWRDRRTGRTIPAELWSLATDLATRHGVSRTARALRVHYAELKQRVSETRSAACPASVGTEPSFVEFLATVSVGSAEISLEMEQPSGSKMRIRLPGTERAVVADLCRLFLGVSA